MAGILGPRAAVDAATLATGLDGDRILAFQLRDGKTAERVVGETAAAIGFVNQEIADKFGRFVYFTDSPYAYYSAGTGGGRRMTPVKTEFREADGVRSSDGGHMLPLRDFEDALAWTPLYLRDARDAQISSDVNLIVESWRNRVHEDFYTRALTNTENAIGSGYDVPWAVGTGVNVPFIPQQYGTYSFTTSHTHFLARTGTTTTDYENRLEEAAKELRHHGYSGRLDVLCSESDISKYAASDNFVKYIPNGITTVGGNTSSPIFVQPGELDNAPGEVFGFYLADNGPVMVLRSDPYIPTGYALVLRSFGNNNPMNPLAIRVHPSEMFGLRLDPMGTRSLVNPELDKVLVKGTHGVGVNNRLAAVAIYWGGSSYTNPTFS
jgi:hypothetical protein